MSQFIYFEENQKPMIFSSLNITSAIITLIDKNRKDGELYEIIKENDKYDLRLIKTPKTKSEVSIFLAKLIDEKQQVIK
jgi:hypothetical protein